MQNIKCVGIIGAGQMGQGIAQVCLEAGYRTILFDQNQAALTNAVNQIKIRISKLVEKGKKTQITADENLSNLVTANALQDFQHADLIIEAIIEKAEAKIALFKELDLVIKKTCVLASNTSSISISKMAAAVSRPSDFIGIHFMNPVPVMKLVEIIRALQTSDNTYQLANSFVAGLQKVAVLGIDRPGFIINRILCPMINEAIFLLEAGVEKESIDQGMKLGTNQPMGPLELADFVGLDTLLYILQILQSELGEDKYRPAPLLIKYVEAGWLGKKSGRGFYQYQS
jgi:3-hydroxybutyryl-CoA dehydrogenase